MFKSKQKYNFKVFWMLVFSTVLLSFLIHPSTGTVDGITSTGVNKEPNPSQLLDVHKHVYKVVCCISVLAQTRTSQSFLPQDFNPSLCTNVLLTDVGIDKSSSKLRLHKDLLDWTTMKIKFPHLNTSYSIGEQNDTSSLANIAANHTLRKILIDDIVNKTLEIGFNGVDLNLAYIENSKKSDLYTLVKELRGSLSKHGLTLTATFGSNNIENSQDVNMLHDSLNFIHLLGFNNNKAGPNAPLQSTDHTDKLTVMASVQFMKTLGVPLYKILLGIPMFGRHFGISSQEGEDAFDYKTLPSAPFTFEDQLLMGYNEICLELNAENTTWRKLWDDISKTPYAQNGSHRIFYEDERSIKMKCFFAKQNSLAGLIAWRVDLDDFRGDCSENSMAGQKFPLLKAISIAMIEGPDSPDVITTTLGQNPRDLSIPIGITVAVLLCAVLAMFVRLLHLRINSTCPTFY